MGLTRHLSETTIRTHTETRRVRDERREGRWKDDERDIVEGGRLRSTNLPSTTRRKEEEEEEEEEEEKRVRCKE